MKALNELRGADIRRINGLTRKMVACKDWTGLARCCVREIPKIVPIDYVAWNIFDRKRTRVLELVGTPEIAERAGSLLDEVNGFLFDWHPILSSVGWTGVDKGLTTMSNYQSIGQFRHTPLYQHAYRHLEADYQAAESIGFYGNINLTMSYNRRLRDFTRRECQILQFVDRRIDGVARGIHRREVLQRQLDRLTVLAGAGRIPVNDLTANEIHNVASVVRGESTPPDTKARLRKKLGLENSKQITAFAFETLPHRKKP